MAALPRCASSACRSYNSAHRSHLSANRNHTALFSGVCVNLAIRSHSAANLTNFSEGFIRPSPYVGYMTHQSELEEKVPARLSKISGIGAHSLPGFAAPAVLKIRDLLGATLRGPPQMARRRLADRQVTRQKCMAPSLVGLLTTGKRTSGGARGGAILGG